MSDGKVVISGFNSIECHDLQYQIFVQVDGRDRDLSMIHLSPNLVKKIKEKCVGKRFVRNVVGCRSQNENPVRITSPTTVDSTWIDIEFQLLNVFFWFVFVFVEIRVNIEGFKSSCEIFTFYRRFIVTIITLHLVHAHFNQIVPTVKKKVLFVPELTLMILKGKLKRDPYSNGDWTPICKYLILIIKRKNRLLLVDWGYDLLMRNGKEEHGIRVFGKRNIEKDERI